eukprot:GGOE01019596.1.p1 GENE.GGOE01019596.1~~GGOE01019596.1.p1  ORF type:complete len:639 (-),score=175.25 GGOE01019596.1:340-2256(-)
MHTGKLPVPEAVERLETQLDGLQETIDILLARSALPQDSDDSQLAGLLLGSASASRQALQRKLEEEQRQNHLLEVALHDLQRSTEEEIASLSQENSRLKAKLKAQGGSFASNGSQSTSTEHAALQHIVLQLQHAVDRLHEPAKHTGGHSLQAALDVEKQTTASLTARVKTLEAALEHGALKDRLANLERELMETKKERDALLQSGASQQRTGSSASLLTGGRTDKPSIRHVRWEDAQDKQPNPPLTLHTAESSSQPPSRPESGPEDDLESPTTPDYRTQPQTLPPPPSAGCHVVHSDSDSGSVMPVHENSSMECNRLTTGMGDWVCSAAFSPDRKFIATGGSDGLVHVREVRTRGLVVNFFGHDESVTSIAFSADGQMIASGGAGGFVVLFSMQQREEPVKTFDKHCDSVCAIAFSPNGQCVASGDSDGAVWLTTVSGSQADRLTAEPTFARSSTSFVNRDSISSLVFSSDGRFLASGGAEGAIRLWDSATLTLVGSFMGHMDWVNCLAFSPNQQMLLSGGSNGTLRLWDVQKRSEVRRFMASVGIEAVSFAPDGKSFITGDTHGAIRLWNTEAERSVKRFLGHKSAVCAIVFSPDGLQVKSLSTSQWGANDSLLVFSVDSEGIEDNSDRNASEIVDE